MPRRTVSFGRVPARARSPMSAAAGGYRDVSSCDSRATEDERLRRQPVPHRLRADPDLAAVLRHPRSTPEGTDQQIGHAEVRPHPADVALDEGLARESPRQHPDVRGGPADVDHERIVEPREETGAPHAVGGAGGERQHGIAGDERVAHQRAVVLADEERRLDAERRQRGAEGVHHPTRQVDQARVEDGRVLAFEETEAADGGREGDVGVREFVADDLGGAGFHRVVDRGEEAGHCDGADAGGLHVSQCGGQALLVEGVRQGSRVLVAAAHEPASAADEGGQVIGPVGEGWNRRGGRERQAKDADR